MGSVLISRIAQYLEPLHTAVMSFSRRALRFLRMPESGRGANEIEYKSINWDTILRLDINIDPYDNVSTLSQKEISFD